VLIQVCIHYLFCCDKLLADNDESQETIKRNVNSLVLHYVCNIHEKWGLNSEDSKTTEIL
jgi:hypothetical protein